MWNALRATMEEAMLKLDEESSSRPICRRRYINRDHGSSYYEELCRRLNVMNTQHLLAKA